MTTATEIEITSPAKEAVLYANTPAFLLDKLRKDVSVRRLIEAGSTEILDALKRSGHAKNALELATRYVLLVALVTSDWEGRWEAADSLDLTDLEWGKAIISLAQAEAVPTTYRTVVSQASPKDCNTFSWSASGEVGR